MIGAVGSGFSVDSQLRGVWREQPSIGERRYLR